MLTDEVRAFLKKPLIAIANTWTDVSPCQLNLRDLAEYVKQGIRAAERP